MRHVERSAIVPFTAHAMFELVADVESYPEFLPGCTGARVHSRVGDRVVASICIARGPLKMEFTTRNLLLPAKSISMELENGPFRALHGTWEFVPLGLQGSRVSLSMRFEFDSRLADKVLGLAFEVLCAHLVEAFVTRARVVCT